MGDKPWRTAELARRNTCVDTKSLFATVKPTPQDYDPEQKLPRITIRGTRRIHGNTHAMVQATMGYKTNSGFCFSPRFTRRARSGRLTGEIGVVVLDIVVVSVEAGCVVVRLLVHDEAQPHALLQHVGIQPGEGGAVATVHEPAWQETRKRSQPLGVADIARTEHMRGSKTYLFL